MADPRPDIEITGAKKKGEWVTFEGRTPEGKKTEVDIHQKSLDEKGRNKSAEEAFIKRSLFGISQQKND